MTWEEAVRWLREQPGQQALVTECYYDDPLPAAAERYRASSEWHALRPLLPVAGRVLDMGAGRGIASYALAREGWSTIALEPDGSETVGARAIQSLAQAAGVRIHIVRDTAEELPFADEVFDLVFARAVLHHSRDLSGVCAEIARVLRAGGVLVATREHVVSNDAELEMFRRNHPLHRLFGGENAFRVGEYIGAMRRAGLAVEKVINSFASDANLFPLTTRELAERMARKVRLPAALIPAVLLRAAGAFDRTPGRLFTFVARKPCGR